MIPREIFINDDLADINPKENSDIRCMNVNLAVQLNLFTIIEKQK